MITAASAAAAVLLATTQGQTAPPAALQTPPADVTSSLNSGPPRPATYLAPEPAPVVAPAPVTVPASPRPATASPAPAPAPVRAAPTPTAAPTRPASTPIAPVTPPAAGPAPVEAPPPPPTVPSVTVLDAAARAALPFTIDLPAGFEIVTGRPGPNFRIYTIRRGDRSFAMVYAGPASQFPIYSGEMVEAGGRATVISTENGVRHAREHLFQREGATPPEIHIWTMSLEGADRALAEQIAGSLDVR